jgi:hypothetical protein
MIPESQEQLIDSEQPQEHASEELAADGAFNTYSNMPVLDFDLLGDESDEEDVGYAIPEAYTREAKPMAPAGVRSPVEQYILDCSVVGRQGPPLTPRASPLSTAAADRCCVPVLCVDHGEYMSPPLFIECLMGPEYLAEAFERMSLIYLSGIQYSQWKPGLQLAAGIGLSCSNISKSNGKHSPDHHDTCMEEPCICQVNSTGVSIMQCHSHRQSPHAFNHLSLAAYWYNFTSELVETVGSFFKTRGRWRAVTKPRLILLDWMLLSYIYLEQEINKRRGEPLRFAYVAVGSTAPKLIAPPKPNQKAIGLGEAKSSASGKRSGVMIVGGSRPKKPRSPEPKARGSVAFDQGSGDRGGDQRQRERKTDKRGGSSASQGGSQRHTYRDKTPAKSAKSLSAKDAAAMSPNSAKKALLVLMNAHK